jgi:SAM-dependent methyltransferase
MSGRGTIDYDSIARMYADNRRASPWVVSHIAQALRERQVREILEVGCGTANHLSALVGVLGVRGYGFDRSAAMLEEGMKRNPGLYLCQGDATVQYPFPAASFDLVFSVDVIHYISDLDRFFQEAQRVLRPGGLAVIVTNSYEDIRNLTISYYFPEAVEIDLGRFPSIAAIERAMRGAGFVDIQVSHTEHTELMDETQLVRYRNRAYSELLLVSEGCYQEGLRRLEEDVRRGRCFERELYTYVWGHKR